MPYLYLTEAGSTVELRKNRLAARLHEEVLSEVPIETVEGIVLIGAAHLSSPLATELLKRGIPVTWLSSRGHFFGRLESTAHINIERQRLQFKRAEDPLFCLTLAKTFITGKIKNCGVVLRRYNRNEPSEEVESAIALLNHYAGKVGFAESVQELLGYEGNAAKIYFAALGKMITPDFFFERRSKQPPKDKFNALLSFGYTVLLYEIYTALLGKGLHPYCSFLHKVRSGHPALASDLIEEWRPALIDSLMMGLAQTGALRGEHFEEENGGVYLIKEGLKIVIKKFEERMRQKNAYIDDVEYEMSFRDVLNYQANRLTRAIEENEPSIYKTVKIR